MIDFTIEEIKESTNQINKTACSGWYELGAQRAVKFQEKLSYDLVKLYVFLV